MLTDDRHLVPLTLLAQAAVSAVLGAALWWWFGPLAGTSAWLGGAAAVVPNGFLAARLIGGRDDGSAKGMMRAAWFGEIGKLVLTALLFGVIFGVVRPISAPAVFGGFIAAQLVVFAALGLSARGSGKEATKKS